ncbi:hypothetical protein [Sharpea azabuensis]|uniref:hypothetical protein n=1 Tax=Sharpea azabuensis TaxID=322505 RepID=UPI0015698272|nr:hypothetical protein [Sharpea azabuensis]
MSYKEGVFETIENIDEIANAKNDKDRTNAMSKNTPGAIANRLLENYIDVVTDPKNFANARQSIDTITNIIKDKLLPSL